MNYHKQHKFPSPCGDYGSYHVVNAVNSYDGYFEFPSPCGDYGSYQLERVRGCLHKNDKFPSPCGDYGSYLLSTEYITQEEMKKVSVPLRGLWFLSAGV